MDIDVLIELVVSSGYFKKIRHKNPRHIFILREIILRYFSLKSLEEKRVSNGI